MASTFYIDPIQYPAPPKGSIRTETFRPEYTEMVTTTTTTEKPVHTEATKFDAGKRDWTLMPFDALEEVVKVLEFGAKKYNEKGDGPDTWNWKKAPGLGKWRTLKAMFRHITAYAGGETLDPESGLNHLAHLACGCLFLLYYHQNPEIYMKEQRSVPRTK